MIIEFSFLEKIIENVLPGAWEADIKTLDDLFKHVGDGSNKQFISATPIRTKYGTIIYKNGQFRWK